MLSPKTLSIHARKIKENVLSQSNYYSIVFIYPLLVGISRKLNKRPGFMEDFWLLNQKFKADYWPFLEMEKVFGRLVSV